MRLGSAGPDRVILSFEDPVSGFPWVGSEAVRTAVVGLALAVAQTISDVGLSPNHRKFGLEGRSEYLKAPAWAGVPS